METKLIEFRSVRSRMQETDYRAVMVIDPKRKKYFYNHKVLKELYPEEAKRLLRGAD